MINIKKNLMPFSKFDKDMLSIFNDFFMHENPLLLSVEKHWRPNTDVYEIPEGIIVKMELAGVNHSSIEITLKGNKLTVKGKRKDHTTAEKVTCRQLEINYGDFYRTVALPPGIDYDKIKATSKDGFLIILVPFKEQKTIKISVEES